MKPSKAIGTVSFAALLLLAWFLLAPPQLGGRTSYAVIYGISMNPRFHSGDLVLLRQQPSYSVGEIVGYHSQKLGRPVMHRIIKIDDAGHYYFQGDNNNFVDPEHPLESQLFGREWVRVPALGAQLEKLHEPRNAAILAAAAALFVLGGSGVRAKRRRRRRGVQTGLPAHVPANLAAPPQGTPVAPRAVPAAAPAPASNGVTHAMPQPVDDSGGWAMVASAGIAAVGLAGLAAAAVLAIVSFTRPPATVVTETNLYTERGAFDYRAYVPLGAVYDHSPLHPGDALFASVVHSFDVSFHYRMTAGAPVTLSGTAGLKSRISDGQGWSHTIPLVPAQTFNGSSTGVTGVVDLDAMQQMISRFEKATDTHNDAYQVVVEPVVRVRGIVAGELVRDDLSPTLTFTWTHGRLMLATANDGAADNGLVRTKSGTGTVTKPQKLGSLGISTARKTALIGLPASIVVTLLGGMIFLFLRGNDEVALIRRRYGAWLIDVTATARPPHVERPVDNMDALARIAERYERLILHEQRGPLHSFLVEDDGIVYRYDAREKSVWRAERHHERRPEAAPAETVPGSGTTPDA